MTPITIQAAGLAAEIAKHLHRLCLDMVEFCWSVAEDNTTDPCYIRVRVPPNDEMSQDAWDEASTAPPMWQYIDFKNLQSLRDSDQDDDAFVGVTIPASPEEVRQCFRAIRFFCCADETNISDEHGRFDCVQTLYKASREIADGLDVIRAASLRALVTESELWMETTFFAESIYAVDAFNELVLWHQKWFTMSRLLEAKTSPINDPVIPSKSAVLTVDANSPFEIVLKAYNEIQPHLYFSTDEKMESLWNAHREASLMLEQKDWSEILGVTARSIRKCNTWKLIKDLRKQGKIELAKNRG